MVTPNKQRKPVAMPKPKRWDYKGAVVPRDTNDKPIPQDILVEGEYQNGEPFSFTVFASIPSWGDLIEYGTQVEIDVGGDLFKAISTGTLLKFVQKYLVEPKEILTKTEDDFTGIGYLHLKAIVYALHKASGVDIKSIEDEIKKKVNINDVLGSMTLSDSSTKGDIDSLEKPQSGN